MKIEDIDWLEGDPKLAKVWEEWARAWLFKYLRDNHWAFCYKIEDVWVSQKPFDSIIDMWNNLRYLVEFKYDRHKKFDPEKIKATTLKQMEPIQMAVLIGLKHIKSTVHVITYVKCINKFILLTY